MIYNNDIIWFTIASYDVQQYVIYNDITTIPHKNITHLCIPQFTPVDRFMEFDGCKVLGSLQVTYGTCWTYRTCKLDLADLQKEVFLNIIHYNPKFPKLDLANL